MELGEIIKKYREEHNLSLRDFSKRCNLSYTYIAMLEKGSDYRNNKPLSPTLDAVNKVALGLNMSLEDLLKIMDNQEIKIDMEIPKINNAFPTTDIPVRVPVLGKISAGLPILAVENIEGYEFAPSSYMKKDYEYFYLRVKGDSMNLKFPEGNLVLVQKQPTLENAEIGVFRINGDDATVKRFKEDNGLIVLEPMSSNPIHQVQIYNPQNTPIEIIGKVILHLGEV